MRNVLGIVLLIFTSCKSDTKTEIKNREGVDKSVYEMWNKYTIAHPASKDSDIPETFFFHNNEEDANRLAKLILNGQKQAGSGLYVWYEEANAALPKVGTKSIVTDFNGKAQAIIEVTKVDTIPFNLISKEYAELDMGTTIEPLKKWKKAHWDFFTSGMEESRAKPTEEMLIVCEWFTTIWPANN